MIAERPNTNANEDIFCVDWSPDCKYAATGQASNVSVIYFGDDLFSTGKRFGRLDSYEFASTVAHCSVNWSPDGKFIAVGTLPKEQDELGDLYILGFEGSSLALIAQLGNSVAGRGVAAVSWSPDGKYIATGWNDNKIKTYCFDGTTISSAYTNLWSAGASGTPLHFISEKEITSSEPISSVSWSPGGRYIAAGSSNGYVQIFSFDGGFIGAPDDGLSLNSTSTVIVDWSPIGKFVAVGTDDFVQVLDFDENETLGTVTDPFDSGFTTIYPTVPVVWSPDGKFITCAFSEDTGSFVPYVFILSFDVTSALTEVKRVNTSSNSAGPLNSVAWTPCGMWIISAGNFATYSGDTSRSLISIMTAMSSPKNCLVKNCSIAGTCACGQLVGTGITGGGTNSFFNNSSCVCI